jgi:hypothetical protein
MEVIRKMESWRDASLVRLNKPVQYTDENGSKRKTSFAIMTPDFLHLANKRGQCVTSQAISLPLQPEPVKPAAKSRKKRELAHV